jgi:hypothetical protein
MGCDRLLRKVSFATPMPEIEAQNGKNPYPQSPRSNDNKIVAAHMIPKYMTNLAKPFILWRM